MFADLIVGVTRSHTDNKDMSSNWVEKFIRVSKRIQKEVGHYAEQRVYLLHLH